MAVVTETVSKQVETPEVVCTFLDPDSNLETIVPVYVQVGNSYS